MSAKKDEKEVKTLLDEVSELLDELSSGVGLVHQEYYRLCGEFHR